MKEEEKILSPDCKTCMEYTVLKGIEVCSLRVKDHNNVSDSAKCENIVSCEWYKLVKIRL